MKVAAADAHHHLSSGPVPKGQKLIPGIPKGDELLRAEIRETNGPVRHRVSKELVGEFQKQHESVHGLGDLKGVAPQKAQSNVEIVQIATLVKVVPIGIAVLVCALGGVIAPMVLVVLALGCHAVRSNHVSEEQCGIAWFL